MRLVYFSSGWFGSFATPLWLLPRARLPVVQISSTIYLGIGSHCMSVR